MSAQTSQKVWSTPDDRGMFGGKTADTSAPYALQDVAVCVLCGGSTSRRLFDIPPYGYRSCSVCGLVRLTPRIAPIDLGRYYDEAYRDVYVADGTTMREQLSNPTFRFRERRLARHSPGRRFFEVGCGDGNFLAVLRDKGWDVAGSDVSEAAAVAARERHAISVAVEPIDGAVIPGCWDAIGLYHVLEHLYEPRLVLRRLRAALTPGGVLHVQMPNRRSVDGRVGRRYWWGLRCPEHVFFYEPAHLRRLLAEEGFAVISVETYDPWHSPGTVEITARNMLKALLRRGDHLGAPSNEASTGERHAVASRWRRVPPRALRDLSTFIAMAQARVGLGNVSDVIAVRRD